MIDVNFVKNHSDLLAISSSTTNIRKVANSGGGEYAGPCPFCGGRDRFRVQPGQYRWLCRHCTDGKWRDVIEFIARLDHLDPHCASDLKEICRRATGGTIPIMSSGSHPVLPQVEPLRPPSKKWQEKARELIVSAEHTLWSPCGIQAMEYLHKRGLTDDTIQHWHLGFVKMDNFERLDHWGLPNPNGDPHRSVWVPAGITIPCLINNDIWYVKVRRFDCQPKYVNIRGGKPALFGADNLVNSELGLLTEGEFDCILAWQELGEGIGVGTLGSASTSQGLARWQSYLDIKSPLLVVMDADEPGQKAAEQIQANTTPNVYVLQSPVLRPEDKDLTDFHISGGCLNQWLQEALDRIFASVQPFHGT